MAAIRSINAVRPVAPAQFQGSGLDPTKWTVEVPLQNRQFRYVQFNTQQEAQNDIAQHSGVGRLIAPGSQQAAPQPQGNGQPVVRISTARQVARGAAQYQQAGLNPALWTVEVRANRQYIYAQFNTQQEAQNDINAHGAGTLVPPIGTATAPAPTPPMNSTPAPPPPAGQGGVSIPATRARTAWRLRASNGRSFKFTDQALLQQAASYLQGKGQLAAIDVNQSVPNSSITRRWAHALNASLAVVQQQVP